MFKLLNIDEFSSRIVVDMQKHFPIVKKEQDFIYVEYSPTNMSIPLRSIYSEYCANQNYELTLKTYVNIANKILSQYKRASSCFPCPASTAPCVRYSCT